MVAAGALLRKPGYECEIDLLALTHDELIVGEVKVSAGAFTLDYVKSLVDQAQEIGADRLVLATTDDWPSSDRDRAEFVAQDAGLEVTTLDSSELIDEVVKASQS